jgi:hypothetical protein
MPALKTPGGETVWLDVMSFHVPLNVHVSPYAEPDDVAPPKATMYPSAAS